jgi:hypothetical protein
MLLDCHLFADLQEGASKNVALTYHIKPNDEDTGLKYSFATPGKVYESLQQTIAAGCLSTKRIADDVKRIFSETLVCIAVEAQGCYIEDSSKKIVRRGVRAEAAAEHKRETIPVEASVLNGFNNMLEKTKNGAGVSFLIDLTDENKVMERSNDILTTIPVTDDKDDDDGRKKKECGQ